MIGIGQRTPRWRSYDDTGNPFGTDQLGGRVSVLHFFVLAWTGV